MKQKNFLLKELRVLPECDKRYLKVLKADKYRFNQLSFNSQSDEDQIEKKIFGDRVFIQTIVGKNGSGKSSILELVYRVINNYSYFILLHTKPKRVAAAPVFLIEGLHTDLDFIIDGIECSILVRNKSIGLIQNGKKLYFGKKHKDFKKFEDYNHKQRKEIVALASSFFYTIVTNYSFQSLINQDFKNDIVNDFIGSKKVGFASDGNWLDSLFRKNDGYITPIVLNPYREDGKIDLSREYSLTLYRISALLIEAEQRNNELLTGYRLSTIRYTFNTEHFIHKLFKKYNPSDKSISISKLYLAIRDKTTVASHIINAYNLTFPELSDSLNVEPYAYLIYKTLSVLEKYAHYEDYPEIPLISDFNVKITETAKASLDLAIEDIRNNKSHVNNKIFQTLNYLKSSDVNKSEFLLEDYLPYKLLNNFKDLEDITEHLPPPFFEPEIMLYRTENKESQISFSTLSSGERQFIYTISTIIYHIKNLLSIQQVNRIRYRNINIVLDEVEICFHPEYQRKFINWFLELLFRLNLTRNCSFNILIVTHSPFILSDIPKKNILYLKDGKQAYDETLINPFSANINDILYQSFFLEGGFIGEHSKNKISSAMSMMVRKINGKPIGKNSMWNEDSLKQLIILVGEPLLKDNLTALYNQAFQKQSIDEVLKAKDEEIQKLKMQLDQEINQKR